MWKCNYGGSRVPRSGSKHVQKGEARLQRPSSRDRQSPPQIEFGDTKAKLKKTLTDLINDQEPFMIIKKLFTAFLTCPGP
jgi:hypothetical protein